MTNSVKLELASAAALAAWQNNPVSRACEHLLLNPGTPQEDVAPNAEELCPHLWMGVILCFDCWEESSSTGPTAEELAVAPCGLCGRRLGDGPRLLLVHLFSPRLRVVSLIHAPCGLEQGEAA